MAGVAAGIMTCYAGSNGGRAVCDTVVIFTNLQTHTLCSGLCGSVHWLLPQGPIL